MTQGICRSAGCPNAANATPIERYPGPGEYCPQCGEKLEPLAPSRAPTEKRFHGLTPLEALQQVEAATPPVEAPPRRSRAKVFAFGAMAVALTAGGALVAIHPAAIGRPGDDGLHVCRSSINQRFASDVVAAYRVKSAGVPRVELTRDGECDVRFSVVSGPEANGSAVIGRDAIVVVVNPQNPLARLTIGELRQILTGEVTTWSQLGAGSGPIGAVVPDESSDEWSVVEKRVLNGTPLTHDVRRVPSTADVVALVSGVQGRSLIGIAAFSGAVPAKVVRLGFVAAPSLLSIAQQRYPLAVAIAVESAGATPPAAATDFIRFARSDDTQAIAARDGLVPRKGY